ncbi:MAG: hypothetical protein ACE5ER_03630 [Nitrospinaceae bacterium]
MSKGTIATLLFLTGLGGLSFMLILSGNDLKCKVCIEFNDIEVCEYVEGKNRDEMVQLGVSTACAGAANGRTESMDCSTTPPKTVECTGP